MIELLGKYSFQEIREMVETMKLVSEDDKPSEEDKIFLKKFETKICLEVNPNLDDFYSLCRGC